MFAEVAENIFELAGILQPTIKMAILRNTDNQPLPIVARTNQYDDPQIIIHQLGV